MACHIAFIIFPQFQQLDLAGPMAVFEAANLARPGSYTWRVVASKPGPVRSSVGVHWAAQPLPRWSAAGRAVDVVMVIGGDGVDAACLDTKLMAWLRRASTGGGSKGARITSICSGSLVLAATGVLDHRAATTHWSRRRQFERNFPLVALQPDRIHVREPASRGRANAAHRPEIWTSAGMTAGIDLCLALCAHDHGEELAREVARQLVVERRRPGGQSQFSTLLELQRPEGRFGALLEHVRQRLGALHSVDSMATWACMSPRHFARSFRAETGSTPAHAVERLRVEAARAALESGGAPIQSVAADCGFGTGAAGTERMRRSFVRLLGRPPAAFRVPGVGR